jgi:enoyl-CoA hydratase/carnithine racemase
LIRLKKEKNIYILILENKPVNALSQELISELLLLTKEISSDKEVKGLIISSSLKDFCAGADLKERASMSNEEAINTVYAIKMLFESIYNLPFPTLSLIKGACLGGGLELALSCDFRFGTTDSFYGLPETSLGIIPGAGGTQLLPRLIGLSNAKYMIYSSKNINANRAVEYGLIDRLINHNIESKALDFMEEFIPQSSLSLKLAKKSIDTGFNVELKSALNIEFKQYIRTLDSKDRISALQKFKKS